MARPSDDFAKPLREYIEELYFGAESIAHASGAGTPDDVEHVKRVRARLEKAYVLAMVHLRALEDVCNDTDPASDWRYPKVDAAGKAAE